MKVGEKVEIVSGMFEGHIGILNNLRLNGTCDVGIIKEVLTAFVKPIKQKGENHDSKGTD